MKKYIRAYIIDPTEEEFNVRMSIADNPNTRPDTLRKLYLSAINAYYPKNILIPIARNPNTPQDVVDEIYKDAVKDNNFYVLSALTVNPNFPEDKVEELLGDKNILRYTILDPKTSNEILMLIGSKFAHLLDTNMIVYIARNPSLSEDNRERISRRFDINSVYEFDVYIHTKDFKRDVITAIDDAISKLPLGNVKYKDCDCEFADSYKDIDGVWVYKYSVYVYFTIIPKSSEYSAIQMDIEHICTDVAESFGGFDVGNDEWEHYANDWEPI